VAPARRGGGTVPCQYRSKTLGRAGGAAKQYTVGS